MEDRNVMGIFLGFLCLLSFGILAAKAVTKRLHIDKTDRLFMRAHKPVSALCFILCLLHMIFVLPVWKGRSLFVLGSGFLSAAVIFLLIILCHTIKDGKKKMRWHRGLTLLALLCVICHMVVYQTDFYHYQQKVSDITFDEMELTDMRDGSYEGEYDVGYIYARVEVEIEDGKIVSIDLLEHRNERGEAAETMIDDIVEKQSLAVDGVSGATNSGSVIKKAVEDAVKKSKGLNSK